MSDIVNDRANLRFELTVDGDLAVSYYKLDGNVVSVIHTEVPPELGGKGVGSRLVRGALDQIRAEGLKVIPVCPFIIIKAWIAGHPECRDLVQT